MPSCGRQTGDTARSGVRAASRFAGPTLGEGVLPAETQAVQAVGAVGDGSQMTTGMSRVVLR